MCFENKVVFITGANGGLAKSFIEALLKENAKKIYCTARDLEKLAELKKLSSKIEIFNLDITKKAFISEHKAFFNAKARLDKYKSIISSLMLCFNYSFLIL